MYDKTQGFAEGTNPIEPGSHAGQLPVIEQAVKASLQGTKFASGQTLPLDQIDRVSQSIAQKLFADQNTVLAMRRYCDQVAQANNWTLPAAVGAGQDTFSNR